MKLTVILLLTCLIQVSARSFGQTVTLNVKDQPIEKVFSEIERQTGFSFLYGQELIDKVKTATVNVKNASISETLNQCLKGHSFTFKIINKTISIDITSLSQIETIQNQNSQLIDVRGKVTDENGKPVEGVTVTVKGTRNATSTNNEGEFFFKTLDQSAILVFTSVNMERFQLEVAGQTDLIVKLKTKISALQDIIVRKGYYDVKLKENTGNVSIVQGTDLQKQPITDPIKSLEGLVPGLYITQSTGLPGGQFSSINIRGKNSIAGGVIPLIIVDGVPLPASSLSSNINAYGAAGALSIYNGINNDDIESIEVLKDADATAIYGSRGANGVILITTKKGKAGKATFNANVYRGVGKVTNYPTLMNTNQYLALRKQAFTNDGATPQPYHYDVNGTWDTTRYTNWKNLLINEVAKTTNANVSISGGSANTQFLLSGSYIKQTTVFPGDFYDQTLSTHFSITHSSINQKLRLGVQSDYASDRNVMPLTDVTQYVIATAPNSPLPFRGDGSLNWENSTWWNPFSYLKQTSDATTNSMRQSFNFSYEVFHGLSIKTFVGYNDMKLNVYNLSPITAVDPAFATTNDRTSIFGSSTAKTWIAEPQVDYSLKIKKNKLYILGGTTFQNSTTTGYQISGSGFTSDDLLKNIALAATKNVVSMRSTQYKLNKFYGRIGYNYNGKYLINLTGSREGSSRFGNDRQFGNFGAVGVGYIFTNENWVHNKIEFLSYGKIRASYGTTGNDQIGDYQYLSTYSGTGVTYQGISGLTPTALTDPFFSWETVKKLEAGLELGFLQDKIYLSASYFKNRTVNQLVGYVLPTSTGFNKITSNFPAIVENTGLEILLTTHNIKNRSFEWTTSLNLTLPRNKLVDFPNIQSSSYARSYSVGKPLGAAYVLHFTGVDPQTGIYTFQDLNGDNKISYPADYGFFAETKQNYYGGMQNQMSYKNIHLDFLLQFVDKTATNYLTGLGIPGFMNANEPVSYLNHWSKPGDTNPIQKVSQDFSSTITQAYLNWQASDAGFTNISYLRLRNITFSYDFPKKVTKDKVNIRIFLEGQNLFTITNYPVDPEVNGIATLPTLKIVAVGLNIRL